MRFDAMRQARYAASGLLLGLGLAAAPVIAAPAITSVNADLTTSPYTFSFLGSSFTVLGNGGFPNYLSVSTAGGGAVRTVFGSPSTDFTDRGTVIYDASTLGGYASFSSLTSVPYTNGDNYLGLRASSGGQDYYGFLFTTNSTLNSYGFERTANTGINPATALAAVPESSTWAMMIGGFGLVGGALRRSQRPGLSIA
jgi:hypothetical protein